MKIVCKVDHISVPVSGTHRLVLKGESIEVTEEQGYQLLANYPLALAKGAEEFKTKDIPKAEQLK